ncbi:MAG: SDR family oxidoreductase [Arachidicoccus sp.]|nr:SDR family oxidoreductase [Arachidicoccus sp.]
MNEQAQFQHFWAIILGGSSGFGLAAIEKLSSHGMNIALLYRETAAKDKELKQHLSNLSEKNKTSILPFNINALDRKNTETFIEEFNEKANQKNCVRLLLHSIARGNLKPLVDENDNELSQEDIELTTYAMATSLLDWTKILLKENLFCKDARVIALTSEGSHKYWESYAAVGIAKSSLESLATYMAVEFAKFGIKTNLIQAGITQTPSFDKIPGSKALAEFAEKRNPLGRITKPEDVANVIYLLCKDEANWINGSLIHVDGGEHCK